MSIIMDHETLWAVCLADRDERLRQAAMRGLAAQVPREPWHVRTHLSRWLHAIATRLDPTVEVLRPDMLVAR